MRRVQPRAFTLIELLLVMVILAVLAGIAVPIYGHLGREAKIKATKATVSNVAHALQVFEVEFDRYPTTVEGLNALVSQPVALPTWDHAFLEKVPADAWGRSLDYLSPGSVHPESYDLASFGEDNIAGTADDITRDDI